MSLDRHINLGWQGYLCRELGEFIDVVPPQQRIDEHWYQGTADAVYQNIYTIEKERPDVRRDPGRRPHLQDGLLQAGRAPQREPGRPDGRRPARAAAEAAAAVRRDARSTPTSRVVGFEEKPRAAQADPRRPEHMPWPRWASTSSTPASSSSSCASTPRGTAASTISAATSSPSIIHTHRVFAYPVPRREPQEGRLLARRGHAGRLLRGQHGPDLGRSATEHVRRATGRSAPTSRTFRRRSSCSPSRATRPAAARPWTASSARAAIISGGQVERSILGPNVRDQQLCPRRGFDPLRRRRTSAGTPRSAARSSTRGSHIPAGIEIGYDHELDRSRGFTVSESGLTVIAKTHGVEHFAVRG